MAMFDWWADIDDDIVTDDEFEHDEYLYSAVYDMEMKLKLAHSGGIHDKVAFKNDMILVASRCPVAYMWLYNMLLIGGYFKLNTNINHYPNKNNHKKVVKKVRFNRNIKYY